MKKFLPIIIALIVVGGGAFYGGMKYAESKKTINGNFSDFANLSATEQRQRFQQMGGARRAGNNQSGANFINGEVIAKDDNSITVKLNNGGSKIIFFSQAMSISKFASGTPEDLATGKSVSVNGTANQDGSLTAQSIQIRPELPQ